MIGKIEILHLALFHGDRLKPLEEYKAEEAQILLNEIAQSQLPVAKSIKDHPNIPVVCESIELTMSHSLNRGC